MALDDSSAMRSNFELHQALMMPGDYYGLAPAIDLGRIASELEAFEAAWMPYNPAKGDFKRQGLSLTSLDGGLSGEPDLTSLREHNLQNGTELNELSFRRPTPVFAACSAIHSLIQPLQESLGRCHFLKFGTGGFFPFHRDSVGFQPDAVFRIFVPLYRHSPRDFVFLYGDQRIHLEPGRPYFINTVKEHAVFSFDEQSVHLVLNVHLNEHSVQTVLNMLHSF